VLKVIFMGTPDFALPVLEAIIGSGCDLLAVVTQPDKPKGRGKQLASPPVKIWAENHGILVLQPEKVKSRDFIEKIAEMAPDLIVTAAFGQILPNTLLDVPPLGCINVHASLLPKYRGASPIQQALIDGEEKTGVTIMYMDVGMDTGDIILTQEISIDPDENAGQLHDRLAALGGEALGKALELFKSGKPAGIPQDHSAASYCSKIEKSMGEIRWDNDPAAIKNLVRGLTPWPGAFTCLDGQRLKVWKACEWEYFTDKEYIPGTVIKADTSDGLIVGCRGGALRITWLQGPGGKAMDSREYLRGHTIPEGSILG